MPDAAIWPQLVTFVSQVGFPIFVAMWLLFRGDRCTVDQTAAIKALTQELALMRQHLELALHK